jgi:hypothetical protein
MQAIVEWLKALLEILKSLSYERLFVGSVVVATLAGSLYVYLVDHHDAPPPDQAQGRRSAGLGTARADRASDPRRACRCSAGCRDGRGSDRRSNGRTDRVASRGRRHRQVRIRCGIDRSRRDVGIADGADNGSDRRRGRRLGEPGRGAACIDRGGRCGPVVPEPSAPSADRPMTGAAAVAELPGPVQAYPPVPPGYMPMPAPGYAPAYPPYQAPPAAARQAPGVPSGTVPVLIGPIRRPSTNAPWRRRPAIRRRRAGHAEVSRAGFGIVTGRGSVAAEGFPETGRRAPRG